MSQEHFDIIVKNVKNLLENKKWNANKLSEMTGIAQPQISKILNGKSRFTLDQIITVAETFNVSLDFLVGRNTFNNPDTIPTNKEIYSLVAPLFENNILNVIEIDVEEDAYVPSDAFDDSTYPYKYKKMNSKYKGFYFPNHTPVMSNEEYDKLDPFQQENYQMNLNILGNEETRNIEFNEFLSYYLKLYDLKKNSNMDEVIYHTAIQDHLDKLKN